MTELRLRINRLIELYEEYGISHVQLLDDIMLAIREYIEENSHD